MLKSLITLSLGLLSLSALASAIETGNTIRIVSRLEITAGERNELHKERGQGFDCDLLMISPESLPKLTLSVDEQLTVVSSKSWHTDWDETRKIIHADYELTSDSLKERKVRMMITCDGSIKVASVEEITRENFNEKMKDVLVIE